MSHQPPAEDDLPVPADDDRAYVHIRPTDTALDVQTVVTHLDESGTVPSNDPSTHHPTAAR